METKDIQTLVILLIFVGMLLGVGVLTLDKYSRAARTSTTVQDDAVNLTSEATLANTYCTDLTAFTFANGTDAGLADLSFSSEDDCKVLTTETDLTQKFNVTYKYGASSAASTAGTNVNTAITGISTTWLPLVVTVAILAIIMTLVIGSFAGNKR